MSQNAQNYISDTYPVITALIVGGIITVVLLTAVMPGVKERADRADEWCQEQFPEQYKGLGNVNAVVDGGAHCILENHTWVKAPALNTERTVIPSVTDYVCKKCGYWHDNIGAVHGHMWKHVQFWRAIYLNFLPGEPVKTFMEWTEVVDTS